MKSYHRHIIFIQKQETTVSCNHWFKLWFLSVCKNSSKAFRDFRGHRNPSHSTACLWILNYILHISCSLKLMINDDPFIFKIKILLGKRISYNTIIHNYCIKSKIKWILYKQIIFYSHLKCRSNNTTYAMNRAVSSSIFSLLNLDIYIRIFHLFSDFRQETTFFPYGLFLPQPYVRSFQCWCKKEPGYDIHIIP